MAKALRRLDRTLGKMKALNYTLPRVMKVVNDINCSAMDLVRVIQMDPVLTARVLQVSNSAYFCQPEPITSLQRATILLGMNTVRNLSLGMAVRDGFDLDEDCAVSSEDFWTYCIGTAVLSDLLASKATVTTAVTEEAFVVGMLHPIGKALLIQFYADDFNDVIEEASKRGCSTETVEHELLEVSHRELGVAMARKWKLPDSVRDGIRNYKTPQNSLFPTTWLVGIAASLIKREQIGFAGDQIAHTIPGEVWEVLRLTPEEAEAIVEEQLPEALSNAKAFIKQI